MNNIIIFFGIGRGGKLAFDFYSNRFVKDCDVKHYYIDQEFVINARSSENFNVGKHRKILSNSARCIKHADVEKFLRKLDFDSMFDIYSNNHVSIKNLLKQLYLLNHIVKNIKDQYSNYIFIRDDTIVDFEVNYLRKISHWDNNLPRILVPTTHWHGGVCDRFFILNNTAVNLFQHRLGYTINTLSEQNISSEVVLSKFLKVYNYRIYSYPINVRRIRSGTKVIPDRYLIPLHRPRELINIAKTYARLLMRT
jgi:hypothetical protein